MEDQKGFTYRDYTQVFNRDCMEGMREVSDGYYDLAIVDPPYGIGEDGKSNHSRGTVRAPSTKFAVKNWDTQTPDQTYFDELLRISKNQVIWGGNYFLDKLPIPTSCMIVWDKNNGETDFADCELAWTSFTSAVRQFTFTWNGYNQGYGQKDKEKRLHPTQKPVRLYKWLLKNYAKPGDKILDTHLGSGSSRIAAYDLGFSFTGYEIDTDYFQAQEKRFKQHISQLNLFTNGTASNTPASL